VLPLKKTLFTLLRAPYRYKLAKNQLMFKRYNILISAKSKIIPTTINEISSINDVLNDFVDKSKKIETNIIYQRKSTIVFSIKNPEFFKYNI
jgi:hypothetical protein